MRNKFAVGAILAFSACAMGQQQWEAGALGGYGITTDVTVTNGANSATTGFKSGPLFGFMAGSNDYRRLGGEASYIYRQSDLKLSGSGHDVNFGGHTHFVDFRFVIHFADRENCFRAVVAGGGGGGGFVGAGH